MHGVDEAHAAAGLHPADIANIQRELAPADENVPVPAVAAKLASSSPAPKKELDPNIPSSIEEMKEPSQPMNDGDKDVFKPNLNFVDPAKNSNSALSQTGSCNGIPIPLDAHVSEDGSISYSMQVHNSALCSVSD